MQVLIISVALAFTLSIVLSQKVDITCGEPPAIQFASVSNVSNEIYTLGTTVIYQCDYGYSFSGESRTLKCVESDFEDKAVWTEPRFSCFPKSCGDPGFINNGRFVGSLFTFPNSVRYECYEGYKLRGLPARYCQVSGSWSGGLPTCERITCNPPKHPLNGRVAYDSLEYSSELEYHCDQGFHLDTDETVFCTADGQWSKTRVECIESNCEVPLKPEHGFVQISTSGIKPREGSIAIFSCESDRIANGPTTSKCLKNGQWTFEAPKCLEPCSIPEISGGMIGKYERKLYKPMTKVFKEIPKGKRVKDNEDLYLRCSDGYEVFGSQRWEEGIFCREGKWSIEPSCEPASCRTAPPQLENAEVMSLNIEHGGSVTYHCLPGFRKIQNEAVFCEFGEWKENGIFNICKNTRCPIAFLAFPGLLKTRKSWYKDGEVFEVECDSGYKVASDGKLRCEDGEWKGHLPPCVAASCTKPPPDINFAKAEISSTAHSSFVKYVCEDPYMLSGSNQVQCLFGEWKGYLPRCEDSRCYLKNLEKAFHISETDTPSFVYSRQELHVICKPGYSARLEPPLCLSGKWTRNHVSPCRESDCSVPRLSHGTLSEEIWGDEYWSWSRFKHVRDVIYKQIPAGNIIAPGTAYFLSCDRGYSFQGTLEGRKGITCVEGHWFPDPVCLRTGTKYIPTTPVRRSSTVTAAVDISREMPSTPSMSVMPTSPKVPIPVDLGTILPEVTSTTESDDCSCEYPVQEKKLVATTGERQLQFLDKVVDGSVVVFRCQHVGYHRFAGRQELKCESCQKWHSSEFPTCTEPRAGDAVILYDKNVNISPEGNLEVMKGQNLSLWCIVMERAVYPGWISPSENRITSSKERKNRDSHGDVLYITDLKLENADLEHEGNYDCSTGEDAVTTIHLLVIDPELRCPEIQPADEITVLYEGKRHVKSTALFSCRHDSLVLIGKAVLTCLTNGKWSDPPPQCREKKCEELVETEVLKIHYPKDREIGSIATFHCFAPAIRTGVSHATCLESGKWSDPTPKCEYPPCSLDDLYSSMPQNVAPDIDHISDETLPFNTTVKVTCTGDLIAVGHPMAKCTKNGTWELQHMQCLPGCPSLENHSDSKLKISPEKDIYNFGEMVRFSCPPGMVLSTESQLVLCMKNGWSETILPDCESTTVSHSSIRTND